MRSQTAGLAPRYVDYINLHGTGTRANDAMEDAAVASVFGDRRRLQFDEGLDRPHARRRGIVEAIIAGLCIGHAFMPGCLGVSEPDPAFRARVLVDNADAPVRRVLSNSFGFGGVNCSLLFGNAA